MQRLRKDYNSYIFKSSALHSPYAVTCPTVAPAALHLSKTRDAALLPAEATARPVDKIYTRLWVHCEMEKETYHLSVGKDTGLGWT